MVKLVAMGAVKDEARNHGVGERSGFVFLNVANASYRSLIRVANGPAQPSPHVGDMKRLCVGCSLPESNASFFLSRRLGRDAEPCGSAVLGERVLAARS